MRDEIEYTLEWEPITHGMRVYTWSGNVTKESHKGREYIPGVGSNQSHEG